MHDRLLTWKNMDDAVPERSAEFRQQPRFESSARLRGERAQRLTEEAVAIVSHELRTPLGAIAHWAQVLQRSPDDRQTVLRAAAAIERSVREQARLVDDLLDMSRINAGKVELAQRDLDLDKSSGEPGNGRARRGREANPLALPASEPLRVRADARRLQQVLVNLLTNAIKFTPPRDTCRSGRPAGPARRHPRGGQRARHCSRPAAVHLRAVPASEAAEERRGGSGWACTSSRTSSHCMGVPSTLKAPAPVGALNSLFGCPAWRLARQTAHEIPSIDERTLTELDHTRITDLIHRGSHPKAVVSDAGDSIESVLKTADLVPSRKVSPDIVTMYSQVLLADPDTDERRKLTLCYPVDAEPSQGFVSVFSPVGSEPARTSGGLHCSLAQPDRRAVCGRGRRHPVPA